jgi:hypothetical protein
LAEQPTLFGDVSIPHQLKNTGDDLCQLTQYDPQKSTIQMINAAPIAIAGAVGS